MGRTGMHRILLTLALAACTSTTATGLTIHDIQYTTDPSGDSPYAAQVVTTGGVVTAVHYDGFLMYEGPAPWQSIFVYTYTAGPTIGDEVQLTGTVQEYFGMTEIVNLTSFSVISQGNPVTPLVLPVADVGQEQYEAALITVENPTVTALLTYGEWTVDSLLVCDDLNDYLYFPQVGDSLESVTGTLFYSFDVFKLEPRSTADIAGDVIAHYALGGDVVTMNATRDVLVNHWIEVKGDRIVGIHATVPPGIPVVATGGLIFPGLIDAHNHAQYNTLGPIPFGQLYNHRDEWRSDPIYGDFNTQYQAILSYTSFQTDNIRKLAEVRAMCSGTTTIQGPNAYGHSYDAYAHEGIGINNAHRWPVRIYHSTFPLSSSATTWQNRAAENWRRFVVHLSEGTNQTALNEFTTWQSWGMLDGRTTVIHGTALGATQWAAMAAVGAHLVWSPESNIVLYGTTTDIPGALAAGVNVALAPDWTESGSNDLLDEMRVARDWSDAEWSGLLTPQMLTEMVTVNAADALGMSDLRGAIAPGQMADLMVIPGSAAAPYDALLASEPADVMLTVVNGRPGYGDPALMNQFGYLTLVEDLTIGGQAKRLALAIVSHGIPSSDVSFSTVESTLEAAYAAAEPKLCCFRGLEPIDCNAVAVPVAAAPMMRPFASPNPCTQQTSLAFSLREDALVSVDLFDVAGRRLRGLTSGRLPAGDHSVKWNGLSSTGAPVPSGVYFLRLTAAGEHVATTKVTVLR